MKYEYNINEYKVEDFMWAEQQSYLTFESGTQLRFKVFRELKIM